MIAGKVEVGKAFFSRLVGLDDCFKSELALCGVQLRVDSRDEKDEKADEMHYSRANDCLTWRRKAIAAIEM